MYWTDKFSPGLEIAKHALASLEFYDCFFFLLRPGLDVEFHMRWIRYELESLRIKNSAFDLDYAFWIHVWQIENVSTGSIVMGIVKFTFFLKIIWQG